MQLFTVLTLLRDSLQNKMVWIIFYPKTFESEKPFMHESFLRLLRVGVHLRVLRPEMRLVPAVTLLNMDGMDYSMFL